MGHCIPVLEYSLDVCIVMLFIITLSIFFCQLLETDVSKLHITILYLLLPVLPINTSKSHYIYYICNTFRLYKYEIKYVMIFKLNTMYSWQPCSATSDQLHTAVLCVVHYCLSKKVMGILLTIRMI